jgi:hypothetical protein
VFLLGWQTGVARVATCCLLWWLWLWLNVVVVVVVVL